MTDGHAISGDTFAALGACLDNEALVDLSIIIAYYNAVVRVLHTLQVELEPRYQELRERFSLPV